MQPIYKGGGKDRHCHSSYRSIYLLNTLTKLFEGLIESRLSQFTEKYDTLTSAQQGSHTSRQIHDAIYAVVFPATVASSTSLQHTPPSTEPDEPAPSKTTTSQERSGTSSKDTPEKSVRIRVLNALIETSDEVDILRGLPEGSRLSPTVFGICAAELIHELRIKFPELKFDEITSIDDFNWIGAFLYVDDMVLIARSATQLQHMIDACKE